MTGRFVGKAVTEWLVEDGADRAMRLTRRLVYIDASGRRWIAPRGLVFDGASIPRLLWSFVGDPFTGDYRRAAIIHDAAYQNQDSMREEADRAFYEAMRTDGLRITKAWVIYRAVRLFGAFAWDSKREEE